MGLRTTNVIIFLLILNASATAMVQSGVASDWGVQPNPGGDQTVDEINKEANQTSIGGGGLSTLFGAFAAVGDFVNFIADFAFAGYTMLDALGVPTWVLNLVFAPQYFIVTLDVAHVFVGRILT